MLGDWYERPDGRWVYDEGAPKPDPTVTGMLPAIRPREVEALHGVPERAHGDVGDWIDPTAPDPTGDEVADPDDPSYVLPWRPR